MIHIRPVSDLRNKFPEIEETRYTHSEVFDQIRGKINGK